MNQFALCSGKRHYLYLPRLFALETSMERLSGVKVVSASAHRNTEVYGDFSFYSNFRVRWGIKPKHADTRARALSLTWKVFYRSVNSPYLDLRLLSKAVPVKAYYMPSTEDAMANHRALCSRSSQCSREDEHSNG